MSISHGYEIAWGSLGNTGPLGPYPSQNRLARSTQFFKNHETIYIYQLLFLKQIHVAIVGTQLVIKGFFTLKIQARFSSLFCMATPSRSASVQNHQVPGVELISPPPHHDIYSIEVQRDMRRWKTGVVLNGLTVNSFWFRWFRWSFLSNLRLTTCGWKSEVNFGVWSKNRKIHWWFREKLADVWKNTRFPSTSPWRLWSIMENIAKRWWSESLYFGRIDTFW